MIYVVLGVGFSGTTLVSELLHHAGVRMIDQEEDDYDGGDKYEHMEFQNINREILGLNNVVVRHLKPADCPSVLTVSQKEKMLALIERQNTKYENWGFKDPRTVVTYPLWRELLPEHRIIVVFRHPSNNWYRKRWRGLRRRYVNPWRAYQHLRQWLEYNNVLLEYGRVMNENCLFVNYEEFMTADTEINRLSHFIGNNIEDKRKQGMYRSRGKPDILFRLIMSGMNRWTRFSVDTMWNRLMHERKLENESVRDATS